MITTSLMAASLVWIIVELLKAIPILIYGYIALVNAPLFVIWVCTMSVLWFDTEILDGEENAD
jgi:ABC-type phosphate transport system permease subunit